MSIYDHPEIPHVVVVAGQQPLRSDDYTAPCPVCGGEARWRIEQRLSRMGRTASAAKITAIDCPRCDMLPCEPEPVIAQDAIADDVMEPGEAPEPRPYERGWKWINHLRSAAQLALVSAVDWLLP